MRDGKRKHVLSLAVALMLAGGAQAATNVTIWYPWGGPDGQAVVDAANAFNASQKDIVVKAVLVEGAGIQGTAQGKFLTAVSSGTPPDAVLYWGQDVIPGLSSIGALQPLDAYLPRVGLRPSAFNATALSAMKVGNQTYGLPQMSSALMLYYNKDMFRAAGLDPNKPPKTLAELDRMAEKLTVKQGNDYERLGFIPWLQQGTPLPWTGIFGGRLVGANGKVNVQNPGTLAALKWQENYVKKYGSANLQRFAASLGRLDQSSGNDPFIAGKVAMEVNGQWHGNFIKRYKPDMNYGVAAIPYPTGGKPNSTWTNSNAWLVPRGARNAEAALRFIAFTTDSRRAATWADTVYNITPVKSAVSLQKVSGQPVMKLAADLISRGNVFTSPTTPLILQLQTELNTAFESVQQGARTATQALATAQKNLDQAAQRR